MICVIRYEKAFHRYNYVVFYGTTRFFRDSESQIPLSDKSAKMAHFAFSMQNSVYGSTNRCNEIFWGGGDFNRQIVVSLI